MTAKSIPDEPKDVELVGGIKKRPPGRSENELIGYIFPTKIIFYIQTMMILTSCPLFQEPKGVKH